MWQICIYWTAFLLPSRDRVTHPQTHILSCLSQAFCLLTFLAMTYAHFWTISLVERATFYASYTQPYETVNIYRYVQLVCCDFQFACRLKFCASSKLSIESIGHRHWSSAVKHLQRSISFEVIPKYIAKWGMIKLYDDILADEGR